LVCRDAEGNPLRDPDSTTCAGTFEGCREIGTLLRAEAMRRGSARAATLVCLGDGAPWIWENARINFPGAVEILDFFHAAEHLGELASALLGPGEPAKGLQEQWCRLLKEESARPVLGQAEERLQTGGSELSPEARAAAPGQIAYFANNLERTSYGEFRAKGYFIGSGVVEAGCKTV